MHCTIFVTQEYVRRKADVLLAPSYLGLVLYNAQIVNPIMRFVQYNTHASALLTHFLQDSSNIRM